MGLQTPSFSAPLESSALSSAISQITLIEGNDLSAEHRLEILHRLSPQLSALESKALLDFATLPKPDGFPRFYWQAIVNDSFDLLLKLKHPPAGMDLELIRLARENIDPVLRDYGLQKLATLLQRPSLPPAIVAGGLDAMKAAALESGHHWQGTALLSWQRMEGHDSSPAFKEAVLACLNSPESTGPARASALQAGSAAGMGNIAGPARTFLQDANSFTPLKLSAIATLGAVGSAEDIPLIQSFLTQASCRRAAEAALDKLIP